MLHRITGCLLLLLALTCSCRQGGGSVQPVSALVVERMDNNYLPLEVCDLAQDSCGVTVRYQFLSQDCLCHSNPTLVCENPDQWMLTVNGTPSGFFLDGLVQDGKNVIEMRGGGEVLPVYLSGDFAVVPAEEGGWKTVPSRAAGLGSLASQGMPFYPGLVAYRRTFLVPEKVGRRVLELGKWKGTACEVWINGDWAGSIPGRTSRLSVGRFLKPGENEVEVIVAGGAQNLYGAADFGLFDEYTIK